MDALPDFVKLAESYGHVGIKVEEPGDVEAALKDAFKRKNDLVFLDFRHRPDRERLSDGPRRQGPDRDDSCRGAVSPTHAGSINVG